MFQDSSSVAAKEEAALDLLAALLIVALPTLVEGDLPGETPSPEAGTVVHSAIPLINHRNC